MEPMSTTYYDHNAHQILPKMSDTHHDFKPGDLQDKHKANEQVAKADNPPLPFVQVSNDADIQANWAARQRHQAYIAATSQPPGMPFPLMVQASTPSITVTSLIIPQGNTASGLLVKSNSMVWNAIATALGNDWSVAFQIPPRQ
jgi:hypothetical protein